MVSGSVEHCPLCGIDGQSELTCQRQIVKIVSDLSSSSQSLFIDEQCVQTIITMPELAEVAETGSAT